MTHMGQDGHHDLMLPKTPTALNVADAKRSFSDLIGRVAYGRETIVIMRRGRPVAKLVPLDAAPEPRHPAEITGWLEDDDPFLQAVDAIVEARHEHVSRVLSPKPSRKRKRR